MLTVLKNNYFRMFQRIPSILFMTLIMLASIVLAVYVTGAQQIKGHIVLVTQSDVASVNSKHLSITVLKSEPPLSSLVKQQYDAYVIDKGNGSYDVKTLKSDEFKTLILSLIKNPDATVPSQPTDRGVGVNIVGFLMMFLLMETFMNLFTFADDKEKGQLTRIAASPISLFGYLAAHCIYAFSMFLPAYAMLAVMQIIGFNIGFTLLQYAFMFLLIGMLGVAFALLLNMFFKKPDNASMLGNSILVLTSVLAGSFYSFSKGNEILEWIIKFLPQKQLLDFAQYMQNGIAMQHLTPVLYIAGVIAVLFAVTWFRLKSQYVKKV